MTSIPMFRYYMFSRWRLLCKQAGYLRRCYEFFHGQSNA